MTGEIPELTEADVRWFQKEGIEFHYPEHPLFRKEEQELKPYDMPNMPEQGLWKDYEFACGLEEPVTTDQPGSAYTDEVTSTPVSKPRNSG